MPVNLDNFSAKLIHAYGAAYHYDTSYPPGFFLLIFKSQIGGLFDGENSPEISSRRAEVRKEVGSTGISS